MYTLCVRRDFIARHFLVGGDWGAENFPNSHHYVLELELSGRELDRHGYLCDLVEVEKHLEQVIARYREQLLNDLPEFAGLNPSLEHFARVLAERLSDLLTAAPLTSLTVRLWEHERAWASYRLERREQP
ncbi:MAG: 6-carboxytetrahydropterin synthase [Anaerolineales bacterium]|nr:6-carboxytetrahydropterin synthase [Anaerolineales bacterium]MCX7607652.1 6-carboxytetrahydropterin synthase [Anaerolineales bacterium]